MTAIEIRVSRSCELQHGALAPVLILLNTVLGPSAAFSQGQRMTVTVGRADADVIGSDNVAIQKAIDRVAAAGGGTVVIKAGTYMLSNAITPSA